MSGTGGTTITVMAYDSSAVVREEVEGIAQALDRIGLRKVTWIIVRGKLGEDELDGLRERLNLHPVVIEEIDERFITRPKLVDFEEHILITWKLLRLVDRGNCYVKLSAPYEVSRIGAPGFDDVAALAKALAKAAPERLLWASHWPHPGMEGDRYPNDAALLDLMLDWVPDEASRHKMFVENPAHLYGF